MEDQFLENVHLYYLEQSSQYKNLVKTLQDKLQEQGEDVLTTEVISTIVAEKDRIIALAENKDRVLSSATFLLFIKNLVSKLIKPLYSYSGVEDSIREVITYFSNKGGQFILDSISDATDTRPKVFKLENELWQDAINERIEGLGGSLDDTSIDTLARTIQREVASDLPVKEIIAAAILSLKVTNNRRGDVIAITEGNAAYETMKLETALKNGVEVKMWMTARDDRVCDRCNPLNMDVVMINEEFTGGYSSPPVHPRCRCSIAYLIEPDYKDYFTSSKKKAYEASPMTFYKQFLLGKPYFTIVNPNALWVGGDGLVGKDKEVGMYKSIIKLDTRAKNLLSLSDGIMLLDVLIEEGGSDDINIKALIEARTTLSPVGFLQLVRSYGYDKIITSYKDEEVPSFVRPYTDVEKIIAQDKAFDMTDENDNIYLEKYRYSVKTVPNTDLLEEGLQEVSVSKISFGKDKLKGYRVVNVIDNFNEAQRKGGGAVRVYYDQSQDTYTILGDGNHRLLAAKLLGLKKIQTKVFALRTTV